MYKYGMEAVRFTACHLGMLYSVASMYLTESHFS